MKLPGPFEIQRVVEAEGPFREPDFILPDATPEHFAPCKAAQDPRFYDRDTNQLIMSFHSIVIRTERSTILVDTCIGNDKERSFIEEWHLQNRPFLQTLASQGVKPEEVDYVMCTHLHSDHVGWNTQLRNGRWVPTFPNAKYVFARKEAEYWQHVYDTDPEDGYRRSWEDSVQPILEAGQATLVDMDHEIERGITLMPAPGHTPGTVILNLQQGSEQAFLTGDVIHHPVQFEHPEWSSNFCANRVQSRVSRMRFIESVADTGAHVIPAHFAAPSVVRVTGSPIGFDFKT